MNRSQRLLLKAPFRPRKVRFKNQTRLLFVCLRNYFCPLFWSDPHSSLLIKEYVDAKYKIEKVSYAYQYQNRDGDLIFRYDNAKHKPALQFIEHKHTSDGDVVAARSPDLRDLVDEVISCL